MTTTIKDRPILMSGPMVLACRREVGPKTMTRRLIAWSNSSASGCRGKYLWSRLNFADPDNFVDGKSGNDWYLHVRTHDRDEMHRVRCEIESGQRLWVKETHAHVPLKDGTMGYIYRADGEDEAEEQIQDGWSLMGWSSSIHMPRWASRLTLEVVSVRGERVEDITEADAIAEGFDPMRVIGNTSRGKVARERFLDTFYDLNERAPRGTNPWVWVIEFKRVEVSR